MTTKHIPELAFLLTNVEKRYGRKVATSSDFESLSIVIEHHTGELISSSTLKRLWGYVNLNPTPRIATLDILSRFIGHRDFQDFCDSLTESDTFVSTFFTSKYLAVSELSAGTRITIGWAPNRVVDLLYLGEFLFEVEHSANSQLKVKEDGDIVNNSRISSGNIKNPSGRGVYVFIHCRTSRWDKPPETEEIENDRRY